MRCILITDADTGLGAGLVRQYAADGWRVIAACSGRGANMRRPNIEVVAYDATAEDSAPRLAAQIGDRPLDVIIDCAAVTAGNDGHVADIIRHDWMATMTVAAFAPAKLALALRDNLQRGASPKLVAISSFAASIGACTAGHSYSFRAAKAALNSIWRSFSIEWRPLGIGCLLLAPDTGADTDRSPAEIAAALKRTINGADVLRCRVS